ncbi:hypothetical protein OHT57_09210 [Streptomyces sp. NBC_00285]|uniref:hypothetical protein n=1 Tax=Streptomyces sp. NBC_00285 TaxID=2975700 RepID=UPI002E2D07F2|nr:hypothetical protein [Streptomyces sp. NBC_00285]
MPLLDRTRTAGHGRREVRRLKVCTVEAGLLFPHAVQATPDHATTLLKITC